MKLGEPPYAVYVSESLEFILLGGPHWEEDVEIGGRCYRSASPKYLTYLRGKVRTRGQGVGGFVHQSRALAEAISQHQPHLLNSTAFVEHWYRGPEIEVCRWDDEHERKVRRISQREAAELAQASKESLHVLRAPRSSLPSTALADSRDREEESRPRQLVARVQRTIALQ